MHNAMACDQLNKLVIILNFRVSFAVPNGIVQNRPLVRAKNLAKMSHDIHHTLHHRSQINSASC